MSQTASQTSTSTNHNSAHLTLYSDELPAKLPEHLQIACATLPKLSKEQCGHLRHFHNLASQADGQWAFMGNQEPAQEWLDSYRYQLATMAYASGAAHYHRLPALRSVFRSLMLKLIKKMLRREVWGYWYLTSQSGIFVDPDLKELRKPWADPICTENIMYSGHLFLMVSLYSMLFDDDSFDQDGSICFNWDPVFWGLGPEQFKYSRSTLQEAILKEMERSSWIGVCCEPNSVFVVCNQFPILAMRYNDIRNNTEVVDAVLEKYKAAWAKKGMVTKSGLFYDIYRVKQDSLLSMGNLDFTAWACTFMAWNSTQVHQMYPSMSLGFLSKVGDRVNINPPPVAQAIRQIVQEEPSSDPSSDEVISRARKAVASTPPMPGPPYGNPTFGYVAIWVSEVGDPETLAGLLRHADTFLKPSWANGGLYYPRSENAYDEAGNYTFGDPFTGNAALGYARLNVSDGQRKMWERPWTGEDVQKRAWIDGLDLGQGVDLLRGAWVEDLKAMIATFRTWDGGHTTIQPLIKNLEPGTYGVYVDGELRQQVIVGAKQEDIQVQLDVGTEEVNLVVARV